MAILADAPKIQGNILLPFGGQFQAFVALSFRSRRAGARTWLGSAVDRVAGTDEVEAALDGDDDGQGRARRGRRLQKSAALLNIGLTATGLVLLHDEVAGDLTPYDAFWRGPLGARLNQAGELTTAPALLGDVEKSDPANWVVGQPSGAPVDALLTLAADDDETLGAALRAETAAATAAGLEVLWSERGEVRRNAAHRRVEHFGFTDGISQPGVRGFSNPAEFKTVVAAGEFVLGHPGERRPQSWAPRPTPAKWMHNGSFQVFRRMNQDAAGWWRRAGENGGDPETAAAKALGRSLDGNPLEPGARSQDQNDFTYGDDEAGRHTPLYAHIRKMNPREDDVFRDRGHKMLRRGITFGPRFDRDRPDDRERGILFNAYVASIEDQFEFLLRHWVNDPKFPTSALNAYGRSVAHRDRIDGLDPVVGLSETQARDRLPADVVDKIPRQSFGGFVTTTGAVYAFAPSLPALRQLAGGEPLV
ncbi:Dyp-type peroxidase [Actinoplanes sp. NPDC049596]|uniref:Dyp-type peroxidase n=1 Tax=unclassified Actinoplanes TaxID=2626549 RepID=UPI003433379C